MSEWRDIEPTEAARITREINETFGFLEDLIDNPFPLRNIPTGSTLQFRTVRIGPYRFRLTAYRPSGSDSEWLCRVTKRARVASERGKDRPRHPSDRRNGVRQHRTAPTAQRTLRPLSGELEVGGATADRALDVLERELRRRIETPEAAKA